MASWGPDFFERQHDLDLLTKFAHEAGVESVYYPTDPLQMRTVFDSGKLTQMLDTRQAARPQPKYEIIMLCILALGLGARIQDSHVKLLRRCYTNKQLHESGLMSEEKQVKLRNALKEYRHDGVPSTHFSMNYPKVAPPTAAETSGMSIDAQQYEVVPPWIEVPQHQFPLPVLRPMPLAVQGSMNVLRAPQRPHLSNEELDSSRKKMSVSSILAGTKRAHSFEDKENLEVKRPNMSVDNDDANQLLEDLIDQEMMALGSTNE